MDNYKKYDFEQTNYFLLSDIHAFAKEFFYGCRNRPINIIKKKNIKPEHIYRAHIRQGKWIKSKPTYRKAKIFISAKWVYDNVPKAYDRSTVIADIEPLPPKVILNNNQKFSDGTNTYDITMRGERSFDKCYFRVSDVAKIFSLENLGIIVRSKKTNYKLNYHYKFFVVPKTKKVSNHNIKKITYLTYRGIIKCLFNSKKPLAEKFQDWCLQILFTHQFGSKQEKQQLSSKLLGVHVNTIREVFNTSATKVPCVYLFTLGTVKSLRKSMNISKNYDDTHIICKYGFTQDLEKRAYQHSKTFNKIKHTNLSLKYYAYVDPQYLSNCETDIKDYFISIHSEYKYKDLKELVILSPKQLNKYTNRQYVNISKSYGGHIKDLIQELKELKNEKNHQKELFEQKIETLKERHQKEMALKEVEILKLKLQLIPKSPK